MRRPGAPGIRRATRASCAPTLLVLCCLISAPTLPGCVQVGYQTHTLETETYRGRLDRLYPPGAGRLPGPRRDARYLGAASLTPETPLDPFLEGALGSMRADGLARAVGYDVYELEQVPAWDGGGARRRVCDLVFYDANERILRAYRRFEPCY